MGKGAVKKRREEAKVRKRKGTDQAESLEPSNLPAAVPITVTTALESEAKGEANPAPITSRGLLAMGREKRAKVETLVNVATRSRAASGSAAPPKKDLQTGSARKLLVHAETLKEPRPTRKAADGIKTVIDQIRLNELTEESNNEANFDETTDSTGLDGGGNELMDISVSDDDEIVVSVPKKVGKLASRVGKTKLVRETARKMMETEVTKTKMQEIHSESEADDEGT
jgi:hypothetical protein